MKNYPLFILCASILNPSHLYGMENMPPAQRLEQLAMMQTQETQPQYPAICNPADFDPTLGWNYLIGLLNYYTSINNTTAGHFICLRIYQAHPERYEETKRSILEQKARTEQAAMLKRRRMIKEGWLLDELQNLTQNNQEQTSSALNKSIKKISLRVRAKGVEVVYLPNVMPFED